MIRNQLLVLLALGGLSGIGTAQGNDSPRRVTSQDRQTLNERDREAMHSESDPFQIVGLEQGKNCFRDCTPGLAATDGNVTLVDTEALRERQIAMYTDQKRFLTAPLAATPALNERGSRCEAPVEVAPPENSVPEDAHGHESWWIIALSGLGVGGVALGLKRILL